MIRKTIIVCLFFNFCYWQVQAQMVRQISLSAESSYTEHLSLSNDSKDLDVMVKFMFDEINNRLSVTLLSYRSLFVFQEDVKYKQAVKRRKLRPQQLPYAVEESTLTIALPKAFRRQIPKPRRKFIFKRWVSYEGLQAVPQDYKLVNDYIEQHFDILHQRNELNVSLHHLLVMDDAGGKGVKQNFLLSHFKDLNLEYRISLKRNPCLGAEVELEQANGALKNVKQGYKSFWKNFATGQVSTEERYNQFKEMKNMLTSQFVYKEVQSNCLDVQQVWKDYNAYVDSICAVSCNLVESKKEMPTTGISTDVLFKKARQIDDIVTRWLISTDKTERRDLHLLGLKLIEEVNKVVSLYGIVNEKQQQAWEVFREAEKYFQNTINPNKK